MEFPDGLGLAAICEREDCRDAFVSNLHEGIDALPEGAVVGSSSLRRQCQLRARRPDLQIRDLRGNVGTRLRKLDAGEYAAIILASAGPTNLKGLVIERDTGIVGKAVKNSEILMVRNTRQSDQFFQEIDEKTGFVTRSILCAPLNVNQKTIGAIEVLNKIPSKKNPGGLFSDVDQHLLRILSSAAALAIHNAKMASELLRSEMLQQ